MRRSGGRDPCRLRAGYTSGVNESLYDWQTVIAGFVALVAALITVWVTLRVQRRASRREVDALRSLSPSSFDSNRQSFGEYRDLRELSKKPNAPITAKMAERRSRMPLRSSIQRTLARSDSSRRRDWRRYR